MSELSYAQVFIIFYRREPGQLFHEMLGLSFSLVSFIFHNCVHVGMLHNSKYNSNHCNGSLVTILHLPQYLGPNIILNCGEGKWWLPNAQTLPSAGEYSRWRLFRKKCLRNSFVGNEDKRNILYYYYYWKQCSEKKSTQPQL